MNLEAIERNKGGYIMATKWNLQTWEEAKKRCCLNESDIQMAKELGMTPKSLIKNIPTANQQWKTPVKVWIHDLYEEKFDRVLNFDELDKKRKTKSQKTPKVSECWINDGDLPF